VCAYLQRSSDQAQQWFSHVLRTQPCSLMAAGHCRICRWCWFDRHARHLARELCYRTRVQHCGMVYGGGRVPIICLCMVAARAYHLPEQRKC